MLKAVQYIALIAAFFLPWTIGAMRNAIKAKNKKSVMVAAVICSVDVMIIAICVTLAFVLNRAQ